MSLIRLPLLAYYFAVEKVVTTLRASEPTRQAKRKLPVRIRFAIRPYRQSHIPFTASFAIPLQRVGSKMVTICDRYKDFLDTRVSAQR